MLSNNLWATEDNLGKVTSGIDDLLSWLHIISRNDDSDFANPKLISFITRKAIVVITYIHIIALQCHEYLPICERKEESGEVTYESYMHKGKY